MEHAKASLAAARGGFSKLVAYFGENSAALAGDGEFWRDVTAFVHAFTCAQRENMQQRQVLPAFPMTLTTILLFVSI